MFSRRIRGVSEALIDTFNRKARALAAQGADVISLGQALPGFAPPPAALEAARKALDRPETHIYAPDAGDPELLKLIAGWIAHHDRFNLDPRTQLIVTAGGNQAAMLALQCCCDAGDRVLVPSPYFMNHEMAVRLVDAVPVEVATTDRDGYTISASRLFGPRGTSPAQSRDHLADDGGPGSGRGYTAPRGGTSAIIITTPNNPTGAVVPGCELDRLADEAAPHGMYLIVDRTYAGFEFGQETAETRRRAVRPTPAELRPLPPNLVIVGSFSKVFAMTGWRVGYLAGSPELVAQALKAQDTMIICPRSRRWPSVRL
jgi:aspartate/methionine/tyrosine aminotransferase